MEERNVAVRGREMMHVRVSNSPHLLALCICVLKHSKSKLFMSNYIFANMYAKGTVYDLLCVWQAVITFIPEN